MRIGIITIHRLINFGTALQAYALQHYLQEATGYQVEIIDYIFPNSFHKEQKKLIKKIRGNIRLTLDYLFESKHKSNKKFREFQNKYLNLSAEQYPNITSLNENPPLYDIYITGSDQVWNTKTVKNDANYYLCFAPNDKPKIAFSACFANTTLDSKYKASIKERLSRYKYIGVREKSAINIIKDLHLPEDIVVRNTCDPTLLLTKEDYSEIATESKIKIKNSYILVYMLMYAFDPYPALENVIKQVQEKTKLPIIVIGDRRFKYDGKYKFIKGIGPADFLWLFKNASYIITSSFHGTMFSLIYRKPFIAISPNTGDSRIKDILEEIGLTSNLVYNNEITNINPTDPYSKLIENNIKCFIESSKNFLNKAIKQA